MRDDLGAEVPMKAPARRVVSLVPSLTEAIAVTCPGRLVGATDWCTHPAGLDVARVRGTKNPDLRAIERLRPDLVVANQEENRELDVHRLRERGLAVWFSHADGPDALAPLPSVLVPGRALSWYGPAMVSARAQVEHLIRECDLPAPGTEPG